jgi:uncharacterized membrane protein YidH (DUF202 family)
LGLAAWIAFSFGFVLVNGSYALSTLSDPFGWGWNLLGTASFPWSPFDPMAIAALQVGALVFGLAMALNRAYQIARQSQPDKTRALRSVLPITGFIVVVVLLSLGLYLG